MKILLVGEGASELGGAFETLVKRLGLSDAEISCDRVSQQNIHTHRGKGQGFFKRAVRWMLEAQKSGFDGIVLVVDEDGRQERLDELRQAQEYSAITFQRAFGVAIRSFDAWMLADEKALSRVRTDTINRQPNPEETKRPKNAFDQLMDPAGSDLNRSQLYAVISNELDLDVLEARCPKGFAPFADLVRQF